MTGKKKLTRLQNAWGARLRRQTSADLTRLARRYSRRALVKLMRRDQQSSGDDSGMSA